MEKRKEKKLIHLFLVITLLDQKKKIETLIHIGMCIKFGLEDSDLVLLEIENHQSNVSHII